MGRIQFIVDLIKDHELISVKRMLNDQNRLSHLKVMEDKVSIVK